MKLSIFSLLILSGLTAAALGAPSKGEGKEKTPSKTKSGSSSSSATSSSAQKEDSPANKKASENSKDKAELNSGSGSESKSQADSGSGSNSETARVPEGKAPITKEKDEVTEGPVEKIPRLAAVTSIETEELANFEHYAPQIQELIRKALGLTKMNLTYTFGSADPKQGGMDCSGTMYFLLKDFGFKGVPRQSDQMAGWVQDKTLLHRITDAETLSDPEFSALQPGDLLFWSGTYVTGPREIPVTHVMLYLGKLKKSNRHVVFGSSDGRAYQGERRTGVSVFDLSLPRSGSKATFYGFGMIPGVGTIRPPKPTEPVELAQAEPKQETKLQDIAKVPTTKMETPKRDTSRTENSKAETAYMETSKVETRTAVNDLEAKKSTVVSKSANEDSDSERKGVDIAVSRPKSQVKKTADQEEKVAATKTASSATVSAAEAEEEPKFEIRRAELPGTAAVASNKTEKDEPPTTTTNAKTSPEKASSTKPKTAAVANASSGTTQSASNKSRATVRRRPVPPPTPGERIEKAAKRLAGSFRDAFGQ